MNHCTDASLVEYYSKPMCADYKALVLKRVPSSRSIIVANLALWSIVQKNRKLHRTIDRWDSHLDFDFIGVFDEWSMQTDIVGRNAEAFNGYGECPRPWMWGQPISWRRNLWVRDSILMYDDREHEGVI